MELARGVRHAGLRIAFVLAALLTGLIGWGEVSALTALIGRLFFFLFLVLFAVSLMSGNGVSAP